MRITRGTLDIQLTCGPTRDGKNLVFPYTVRNQSGVSILVSDGMPVPDASNNTLRVDEASVSIVLRGENEAVIGKCLPPFPEDRTLLSPPLPLVTRLASGETLERKLDVSLPLAEHNPYLPDLTIRDYEMMEIQAVILAIGYWHEDTQDLATAPARYAPGRLHLFTPEPASGLKLVWQRFPTRGLQLLRRTDAFPRTF